MAKFAGKKGRIRPVSSAILEAEPGRPEALGQSDAFLRFQEQLSRAAKIERPVLIVGERGTGKELAASRLHYLSRRWEGPLAALNCAALAPSLLETELFGHEAGAFTGAAGRRSGRFEAADSGTLFLDEIALIPMQVQEKILRVVEYRAFERVGGSVPIQADVRIIGATNADLKKLAEEGKFKRDLLDRLSFEVLFLPPLRERREDILLLAHHFAARMAMELGLPETPEFSENAVTALEDHAWPGNVRELKNVIERAVYRSDGQPVRAIEFDPFRSPFAPLEENESGTAASFEDIPARKIQLGKQNLADAVRELELSALKKALDRAGGHQGRAAELLGLSYHQFRGLYRKYKPDLK